MSSFEYVRITSFSANFNASQTRTDTIEPLIDSLNTHEIISVSVSYSLLLLLFHIHIFGGAVYYSFLLLFFIFDISVDLVTHCFNAYSKYY